MRRQRSGGGFGRRNRHVIPRQPTTQEQEQPHIAHRDEIVPTRGIFAFVDVQAHVFRRSENVLLIRFRGQVPVEFASDVHRRQSEINQIDNAAAAAAAAVGIGTKTQHEILRFNVAMKNSRFVDLIQNSNHFLDPMDVIFGRGD